MRETDRDRVMGRSLTDFNDSVPQSHFGAFYSVPMVKYTHEKRRRHRMQPKRRTAPLQIQNNCHLQLESAVLTAYLSFPCLPVYLW